MKICRWTAPRPVAACLASAVFLTAFADHPAHAAPTRPLAARVARLEAQVKMLEAEADIRRLLQDYGRDLDRRDFTAYAKLFAKNGDWTGYLGRKMTTIRGRDAIRKAMERTFARHHGRQASFHILTNTVITLHGNHARAASKWTFILIRRGKATIANAGTYHDVLVRRRDGWKFLHRTAPSVMISAAP